MPLARLNNLLCYFAAFLIFFLPAIDTDLGWHLRYGDYFLQTGHFLKDNTLTYFLADYSWAHSYGLYQVLTAIIYKFSGLLGLAFASAALGTVSFWFFSRLYKTTTVSPLITYSLVTLFGWNVLYLGWRAQVFTFLFLLLELWLLKKSEAEQKWLYILPPLFTLWANIHGGFILGLLILSFKLVDVAQGVLSKPPLRWYRFATFGGVLLLSVGATLVNPYGTGIWQEALKHSQYPLNTLIAEWVRPTLAVSTGGAVITGVLLWQLWSRKNSQRVFYSLALLLSLVLLIQARRNTLIWGLFAALSALEIWENKISDLIKTRIPENLTFLSLTSAVIALFIWIVPNTIELSTSPDAYCQEGLTPYPCKSVDFIRVNYSAVKNIFTAYEWGGFLEWQLPQYKYFVDGRMPAWPALNGESPYATYLKIVQTQTGWDKQLKSYNTDLLLIGNGTFLDLELQKNNSKTWKEVYRDTASVVYTKLIH
ncbi:MAG: hypothetical protein HY376_03890 [Candidatus Blackburnbacteria bacterium]|nr:hypothetical protein [Candidatus Blackburnbacteria bacterium]